MELSEIERRLSNAQVAMAYLKNILKRSDYPICAEHVDLEQLRIELTIDVIDELMLFTVLNEIQWHIPIKTVIYKDGFCVIGVTVPQESAA